MIDSSVVHGSAEDSPETSHQDPLPPAGQQVII